MKEKLLRIMYHATCESELEGTPGSCPYRKHGRCGEIERLDLCAITHLAEELLTNGVTVQQWIPVAERLPSKEEYTAKAKNGEEYYKRLLIAYMTDTVEYEIGFYDGYKWMAEPPMWRIKDVLAWMPFPNLPELPKEG